MVKMSVSNHLIGKIMAHELSSCRQKVLNAVGDVSLTLLFCFPIQLLVAHLAPLPKS